jgi:hypothetical protein
MIGNLEDAETALEFGYVGNASLAQVAGGWRYLASGSDRAAYLSPDFVVYKVQRQNGWFSSLSEYENYQKLLLTELPDPWRIPKMYKWDIGLAKNKNEAYMFFNEYGVADVGGHNVVISNDRIYLIDLGS